RLQLYALAVAIREAAEAVPFRFVLPALGLGQHIDVLRPHRRVRIGQSCECHRRGNLIFPPSTGANKSPSFVTRRTTDSIVNTSGRNPRSISSHVTGVETLAAFVGRTEYTLARVRPHAFWL